MRVVLFALVLLSGASAYAAQPQCSDGIDNDGDGQIDFNPGAEGIFATADTDCRSPSWNSEASGSDLGYIPFTNDGGTDGGTDASASTDGGIPPGETCDASSSCNMFMQTDGGSMGSISGGGDATHEPPRHGCDVGGSSPSTLPLFFLLGTGCGLALLSRRTRT